MKRLPVASTTLLAVGYDRANRVLEVEFHHGAVYRYGGVPVALYRQLLSAESKGRFFNHQIRNHFPYVHLPRSHAANKTI